MDSLKRNAPVQVALTGDDRQLIDEHREGVSFNVTSSEGAL